MSAMEKHEDDVHNISNEQLAKMLREIARRHVGQDESVICEAANRLEARDFAPYIPFNYEQFE